MQLWGFVLLSSPIYDVIIVSVFVFHRIYHQSQIWIIATIQSLGKEFACVKFTIASNHCRWTFGCKYWLNANTAKNEIARP